MCLFFVYSLNEQCLLFTVSFDKLIDKRFNAAQDVLSYLSTNPA
ncbi:hypothetical protein HMPREF9446_01479 [Bacteroides fluxus YIT 12057]|uniref:Uncharacterized protein n=1 Tax=Bacteroides fluxus YIT 12057 TaxID=763034 RepID=F3PRX5_9BACE|nr:hypothetical protein HMPREF9446_01479 [Bacteroides fluxus YIT 12057]